MMSASSSLAGTRRLPKRRAQLLHLALRPAVHQRLVGGIQRIAELERQREQHPFPVALVRRHQQHRLPVRQQRARRLEIDDAHPAAHFAAGGMLADFTISTSICAKPG